MDFVERPGPRERQVHELERADLESARLDSFDDVAREAAGLELRDRLADLIDDRRERRRLP